MTIKLLGRLEFLSKPRTSAPPLVPNSCSDASLFRTGCLKLEVFVEKVQHGAPALFRLRALGAGHVVQVRGVNQEAVEAIRVEFHLAGFTGFLQGCLHERGLFPGYDVVLFAL